MYWLLFFLVLASLVLIICSFDLVFKVKQMHVVILEDPMSKELRQVNPGIALRLPTEVRYREFNCRRILQITEEKHITKDSQIVEVGMRVEYFIDALDREGKREKRTEDGIARGVVAARNLREEKKFEEYILELVRDTIKGILKNYIASVSLEEINAGILPENWEKTVACPKCGSRIEIGSGEKVLCTNDKCKYHKKEICRKSDPFVTVLSSFISIEADQELSLKYGVGVEFRILNIVQPREIAEERLEEEKYKAQMKVEKSKKEVKEIQAETLKRFQEETGIPSWLTLILEQVPEIIEKIKVKEKGGEEK